MYIVLFPYQEVSYLIQEERYSNNNLEEYLNHLKETIFKDVEYKFYLLDNGFLNLPEEIKENISKIIEIKTISEIINLISINDKIIYYKDYQYIYFNEFLIKYWFQGIINNVVILDANFKTYSLKEEINKDSSNVHMLKIIFEMSEKTIRLITNIYNFKIDLFLENIFRLYMNKINELEFNIDNIFINDRDNTIEFSLDKIKINNEKNEVLNYIDYFIENIKSIFSFKENLKSNNGKEIYLEIFGEDENQFNINKISNLLKYINEIKTKLNVRKLYLLTEDQFNNLTEEQKDYVKIYYYILGKLEYGDILKLLNFDDIEYEFISLKLLSESYYDSFTNLYKFNLLKNFIINYDDNNRKIDDLFIVLKEYIEYKFNCIENVNLNIKEYIKLFS